MGSSRGIEKCPQSGWGCMGGGATDHHLEGNPYPVQLYVGSHRSLNLNPVQLYQVR